MTREHRFVIKASELQVRLSQVRVLDVRWRLGQPAFGRQSWLSERIAGAGFIDLETDLSRAARPQDGRHPLASPGDFCAALARAGVGEGDEVVVVDDGSLSTAARLWWMLRYVGHDRALILDGGMKAWSEGGHPLSRGAGGGVAAAVRAISPRTRNEMVVSFEEVLAVSEEASTGQEVTTLLLDARARRSASPGWWSRWIHDRGTFRGHEARRTR